VADVAESYSQKINQGDAVRIEFSDLDKQLDSRISFASKVIDPINRTFRIESRIPAQTGVKPNMIAKLKIVDYENKAAITVPSNAIQNTEEGDFVMIAVEENGKTRASKRTVKTGKSGEGRTEILSGLDTNDRVIVVGYQELNEGQIISVSK
jgi:multidrug efflux pump subunit AcrA (membrane-fusion protein)